MPALDIVCSVCKAPINEYCKVVYGYAFHCDNARVHSRRVADATRLTKEKNLARRKSILKQGIIL